MTILRIRHAVQSFEGWQAAFDRDPVGRESGGVKKHTIYRDANDPHMVTIDLEFTSRENADAFLARLQTLWAGPGGAVMRNPESTILSVVESRDYDSRP
ncbi:MAG: hypothetical protein ACT4OZ_16085 [Gemmatimonadota bacterium]